MISQAILQLRCQYTHDNNITVCDINSGLCKVFADDIAAMGYGVAAWGDQFDDISYWSPDILEKLTPDMFIDFAEVHCFIYYNNRFYDSECPQGCIFIDHLPIYQRTRGLIL